MDLDAVRRWVRKARRPTAIDIFCGAGGLSLGLKDAGFTVLVGADSDQHAVRTHQANLGGLGYHGDLTDPRDFLDRLRSWKISEVDLLAGGVPCQPFSRAGSSKIRSLVRDGLRPEDDPRARLWRSFVRIVENLLPRAVLLENVPDLMLWDEGSVLVGFRESLRALGYQTFITVLNAYDFRVPQHRERLFMVGLREGGRFVWPRRRRPRSTVRMAIGDLPSVSAAQSDQRLPYGAPRSSLQRRLRKDVPRADRKVIYDHVTRAVRPDDAKAFALLGEGQTYRELPPRLQRYRSDIFGDKYKRLAWRGLSRSITAHIAKDGYWYIHPNQHRTLSVREAARLQTFPDWFRFSGKRGHWYKQIGNAVPPLLAEAIGKSLHRALINNGIKVTPESSPSFRHDLLEWHSGEARSYPWRRGSDPWHVLMAEMCLHRTRADQVVPVYNRLSVNAKTPQEMIARESEARETMQSLGLNWRIDNIIDTARVLTERHHGRVPASEFALRRLPGVGDYVANAVLSFGYGRRAVLLDTNTKRIVTRLRMPKDLGAWQLRLYLYELAGSEGADSAFNYALLDLGALFCRPSAPRCPECPVRRHCATFTSRVAHKSEK